MGDGPVTQLAQQVGEGLQKLQEALQEAGGPPEEMAQMEQILGLYMDLVQKKMGQGQPQPEGMGQMPVDQGAGGQPIGPQVRN